MKVILRITILSCIVNAVGLIAVAAAAASGVQTFYLGAIWVVFLGIWVALLGKEITKAIALKRASDDPASAITSLHHAAAASDTP